MMHGLKGWMKVALSLVAGLAMAACGGGGGGSGSSTPAVSALCRDVTPVANTFIVEIRTVGENENEIEIEIESAADDSRLRLNGEVEHLLTSTVRGFVIRLPEGEDPLRLFDDDRVVSIEPDVVAEADPAVYAAQAVELLTQEVPVGVRRIFADDPTLPARIDGIDGPGERVSVGVAILDSGIDIDHPDLNVALTGANLVSPGLPAEDVSGHGTHVAGIVAAIDNQIGVVGVAPGATLYPVKVLSDTGAGTLSDVIAGVDWVARNASQVAVANISLHVSCPSQALRNAVRRATEAGVVVVASAGNSGIDIYGPDALYFTGDDRAPACFPEALTVSAMADFDGQAGGLATAAGNPDDTMADFSNHSGAPSAEALWNPPGLGIDLAAPGSSILSTFPGGLYETLSGTSMAAPHVSGAAARLIASRGRDFNLDGVIDDGDVLAIRQALVAGGQTQELWRPGGAGDPDGNPEPLVDARTR